MTEPHEETKEFPTIGERASRVKIWQGYVWNVAKYAESRNLLAKILIADLSFSYLTSNYSLTRNIYYFAILPLALLTVGKDDLRRVLASPIFLLVGMYFAVLTVVSLLAPDARLEVIGKHFRDSLLVLSFLFLLAHLTWKNEAFLTNLLWFLSSAAGLMAIANILVFYGSNSPVFSTEHRLTGIAHLTPVTGLNELGGLYAIACVAAAAIAGRSHLPKFASVSAVIASLVLFLAVILIQGRGALLSVSCGLLVALVFGSGKVSRRLVIGLFFAVLLGGFFLFSPLLTNYIGRADSLRFLVWHEYVTEFVVKRPLLGYGVSTEQIVDLQSYPHPHAHNVVLHAWVKGGIFAALALLATIVFSFLAALRAVRVLGLLPPLALMTTAFVATAIDYGIVASSLGYQWILFWLPIGLCLGSSLRLREQVRSSGAG